MPPRSGSAAPAPFPLPAFVHEASLQHIYDTAPIGLAFLSPDCRYVHINEHLTEICGISVEGHLGRTVRDCVPGLADAVEAIVAQIMAGGEPVTGIEVAGQRPDQIEQRSWITYWHPVHGADGGILGINVAAEEITERKRAEAALRASEEHARFIVDELSHRTKNLMAVVMAIARQTSRHASDVGDYHNRLTNRLAALAQSHDLLVRDNWNGASFSDLVVMQLRPFAEAGLSRIHADGPPLILTPKAVQYLGLAFHELATNASKHGALSGAVGRISIHWRHDPDAHRIHLRWQESEGPAVAAPSRRGFGHVVIEQIVPRSLGGRGKLDFAPGGVSWAFDFPAQEASAPPCDMLEATPI